MQPTPSVDRRFFNNAVETLKTQGVDVAALCARHGLANPLDLPGERLPLAAVSPIYDLICAETRDPELLLRTSSIANMAEAGTIFNLLACCATLFDALQLACRYSSIATDIVTYSFHERASHVDFFVTPCRGVYVSPLQVEVGVLLPVRFGQVLPAGRGPIAQEAFFTFAPRFPLEHYERWFGCPVHFNRRQSGLKLNRAALDTPLPGADARLRDYYRSVAERYEGTIAAGESLPERVKRLFIQRMAFGEPDREAIARALNTSVRTLQRQLREQGVSYRELIEDARIGFAQQELRAGERPVHEVAFLAGYADVRSFRRAFQRVTGVAPGDFRRTPAPPEIPG